MHYKNTIEAVYIHLDEIQQLIANMGSDGNIHTIELDLAMDKLRHVYDLMISLKGESSFSEVRQVEFNLNESTISKEETFHVHSKQKQETQPEEKIIEIEEKKSVPIEKIPESVKSKPEIETRIRTSDGKKFLGETFVSEKHSINEELSQQKQSSDIASQLKSKPITSITGAIGLNEKFELIQNLFGGDKVKYEKTIEILNAAINFNEAYDYLSSNFNWDMNDIYAQRLLELIRRKLIVRKNEQ